MVNDKKKKEKKKENSTWRSNVIHFVLWEGLHDSRWIVGGKTRGKETVRKLVKDVACSTHSAVPTV